MSQIDLTRFYGFDPARLNVDGLDLVSYAFARGRRLRRREFQSARHSRLDRAARSQWTQAAISHWQRSKL
jgi:hypothetical protein